MHHFNSIQMLLGLSMLAGAVHVLAPDHWVPASLIAWQRGWRFFKITGFALLALSMHVALGCGLYFALAPLIARIDSHSLYTDTLIFVAIALLFRALRFSRIHEVFQAGPRGMWGIFAAFSLLGPAESVIPIFVKASQLGTGYLLPFAAFFLGTLVSGMVLIYSGQWVWNKPLWLPRGLDWIYQRTTLVPIGAGLAAGLALVLKLR